jgi:iron complex outermembrane receptor protein
MKKNGKARYPGFHQMCITMKLTALFLTVALVEAHGGTLAQNVSLSGAHLSLREVFSEIKHQTGYAFFYSYDLLEEAHPVTIHAAGKPLREVLDSCFAGQPLDYTIENKTVVISLKEPTGILPGASSLENAMMDPIIIRGKVIDDKGDPIAGASIKVKGGQGGTSTNAEGIFTLRVPEGSVLVVSSVGYTPKDVTVTKAETISVRLFSATKSVDDVVVTGFGESRERRSLGYSVTQVSGDAIRNTGQIDPINAMQGMVTGLQIQPGVAGQASTPKVLLRGANSLDTYGNMPLVVIDGVILDDQSVTQSENGDAPDFGNILKDLNPDDIESLSVLKGGAVTALYGSRAANGVLLIKTKKGGAQKGLGVSFSETAMFTEAYKTTDFQNVYGGGLGSGDWDSLANGQIAYDKSNYGLDFGPQMQGQEFLDFTGQVRKDLPEKRGLLDIFQTGRSYNTNVALSGGDEHTSFRMSYSNLTSNAVLPNSAFNRNSFMLRGTHKVGNWLTVDASGTYVHSYNLNPPQQGGNSPLYALIYDGQRNYDINYWSTHFIDTAGGYNTGDITGISQLAFWPIWENKFYQYEDNIRAGLDVTANILPWLVFNGNVSLNWYDRSNYQDSRGQQPGFADPNYFTSVNDLVQPRYRGQVTATKQFGRFNTMFSVGGETDLSSATGYQGQFVGGGLNPDIYRLSNSVDAPSIQEAAPDKTQLSSLYFQGELGYHNYVTLNVYGRNDWNSTLVYNNGTGTDSYFYYGSDVALIFSDLMKNRPSWFNYGKLRLSYATAGNGTQAYTANTGAYTSQGNYTGAVSGGSVSQYAYSSTDLPNTNLVPEHSSKVEGGLELQFLHNRLGADFTIYNQQTDHQIIDFTVNNFTGVTAALQNGGAVRNRGIELTLNGTPIQTRSFTWTTRFLYTLNRNKVLSLPFGTPFETLNGENGIQTVAIAGGSYGEMVAPYGFASYQAKGTPLNNQPVLGIQGGNGLETEAYYLRSDNYNTTEATQNPQVGNTTPKFLGSWFNTFTYKNFSLSVFLDARFGGVEWSSSWYYGMNGGAVKSSLAGRSAAYGGLTYTPGSSKGFYDESLGTGPRTDGIALHGVFQAGSTSQGSDGLMHDVSGMTFAQALQKGYVTPVPATDYYLNNYNWAQGIRSLGDFTNSWVSLREVSFGYNLPTGFARKMGLNNLRLSLVGRNIIYLYNSAPDHINPENQNNSGAGNAFEDGGGPYTRSWGFMLNTNL